MTFDEYAEQVITVHNSIVDIVQTLLPKAAVRNEMIVNPNTAEWAGDLESENDVEAGTGRMLINTVCIALAGFLNQGKLMIHTLSGEPVFAFVFWREYKAGTLDNNSGLDFARDIIKTVAAINFYSDLNQRAIVKRHMELIMPERAEIVPLGKRQAHWAPGSLHVQMNPQVITGA